MRALRCGHKTSNFTAQLGPIWYREPLVTAVPWPFVAFRDEHSSSALRLCAFAPLRLPLPKTLHGSQQRGRGDGAAVRGPAFPWPSTALSHRLLPTFPPPSADLSTAFPRPSAAFRYCFYILPLGIASLRIWEGWLARASAAT